MHSTLFAAPLIGTIVSVGGLSFFPGLALGLVGEHVVLRAGLTH